MLLSLDRRAEDEEVVRKEEVGHQCACCAWLAEGSRHAVWMIGIAAGRGPVGGFLLREMSSLVMCCAKDWHMGLGVVPLPDPTTR